MRQLRSLRITGTDCPNQRAAANSPIAGKMGKEAEGWRGESAREERRGEGTFGRWFPLSALHLTRIGRERRLHFLRKELRCTFVGDWWLKQSQLGTDMTFSH